MCADKLLGSGTIIQKETKHDATRWEFLNLFRLYRVLQTLHTREMAALGAELYVVMYKKKTVDFIDKQKVTTFKF